MELKNERKGGTVFHLKKKKTSDPLLTLIPVPLLTRCSELFQSSQVIWSPVYSKPKTITSTGDNLVMQHVRVNCLLSNYNSTVNVHFIWKSHSQISLKYLLWKSRKTLGNTSVSSLRNLTLHKKWSFPLRISSANVTKSAGNCGFCHNYWRNS